MFKPQQFAQMVGVTVRTLQRWDKKGVLPARRSITNRRYYTYDDYYKVTGQENKEDETREEIKVG